MSEIQFKGGEQRMLAYKKLKTFIANPGMFALTVLGSRGTGKRFAIERAFEDVVKSIGKNKIHNHCLNKIQFISCNDLPRLNELENNEEKMDIFLQKHQYQTIVLEDVEELDSDQETCLFTALSTTDGKFGINSKLSVVRFIFTSSKPIDELRTGENQISNILWDRISQLVVELPSFKSESAEIVSDFETTWIKMNYSNLKDYKGLDTCPHSERVKYFLKNNADKFDGGFRDLDKLAILYFNYRIFHYGEIRKTNDEIEEKVFNDVRNDFFVRSQLKAETTGNENIFDFDDNFDSLDEINSAFRVQLRKWAISKHNSLSVAAKKLKCSIHTLKNYRAGKATKKERDSSSKKSKGKRTKI